MTEAQANWLRKLRDEGRCSFAMTEEARDCEREGWTDSDDPAFWEWLTQRGREALWRYEHEGATP